MLYVLHLILSKYDSCLMAACFRCCVTQMELIFRDNGTWCGKVNISKVMSSQISAALQNTALIRNVAIS